MASCNFTQGTRLLRRMKPFMRVIFLAVTLIAAPIASQGQRMCNLPNITEVEDVGSKYIEIQNPEAGGVRVTVLNMTFTCLSRVAFDKYSSASVVVNSTTSDDPGFVSVRQFQMDCTIQNTWGVRSGNLFDNNVPSMPFDVETDYQCYECVEQADSTANYNPTTNCAYCHSDCRTKGQGLCKSALESDCCPYFNNDTGACVEDCTNIHPKFGPSVNYHCVCQVSCLPGYTQNTADCSCDLTDGCEAAEQPCQNGGSCTSHLSSSTYYSCRCAAGYTGQNCEISTDCGTGCIRGQCDATTGCCANCNDGYILENNCNCVKTPTTRLPTTPSKPTEPSGVCPSPCQECEVDNPTCCSLCPDGFVVQSCQCVEEAGQPSSASQVAGLTIGLLLFVLLIMSLVAVVAYVLYYMRANKQNMSKGQRTRSLPRGYLQSNPTYIGVEELEEENK